MATHRAHNLLQLHANRVLWYGEIKRQDPSLQNKLMIYKTMKGGSQSQKHRYFPTLNETEAVKNSQNRVICLPSSHTLSLYPTTFPLVKFSFTESKSQAVPREKVDPESSSPQPVKNDKPSPDQLLKVYNCLQFNLPRLFRHTMDYTIYSQDVVLINNILNKTTKGLFKYVQQVALLRLMGHLKYAFVKLELISMSQDPLDCRITVRWRVVGISGLRVFLKFWKFKLWKWQEIINQKEVWYDAISYFDVDADGLVFRHTIDRVEEDKERLEVEKSSKAPLLAKLALIAALCPRSGLGSVIAYKSLLHSTDSS